MKRLLPQSLLTPLLIAFAAISLPAQTTVVSNLSQTYFTTQTAGKSGANDLQQAISFTTGSAANLSSITLLGFSYGSLSGFSVGVWTGISSSGPSGLVTTLTGATPTGTTQQYTFSPGAVTTLSATTDYWLVVSAPGTAASSGFSWNSTSLQNEDAGASAGWSIGNTRWVTLNGGSSWSGVGGGVPQFSVQAAAVPEPATLAGVFGLVALTAAIRCRLRREQRIPRPRSNGPALRD